MNKLFCLLLLCCHLSVFGQEIDTYEKPPVFPECENSEIGQLKECFNEQLSQYIFQNFQLPEKVKTENYQGDVVVLFEVTNEGDFIVLYVDAVYEDLKTAAQIVFAELPKVQPATYNGKATFKQYQFTIKIPLVDLDKTSTSTEELPSTKLTDSNAVEEAAQEYDSLQKSLKPYTKKALTSELNIPFTHQFYARFDGAMNRVGTNNHTAAKPFIYSEASNYYDFEKYEEKLKKEGDSWWSRKIFNEHLVRVQGDNYWFIIDPIFDLQVGSDSEADFSSTYNNTRGIFIQGGLGKKLSFSASVYESQGRFAQYFNQYAESLGRPNSETEVAVVPGRGIAKRFKTDSYDYPVAEAYLSYTPVDFLNIQFGHGKNFIGDGYRSLFLSDVASPAPFLKLNTKFWKIKYTNTWMWLRDIRPEVQEDGAFLTKYIANHYLSWNVSKRLNLGFFESVMWANDNNRGFDINYLNPIIFYRAIEFQTGQDAGNAIVGASAKYKFNDRFNIYSQFILDEFSLSDIRAGEKSWKNKLGYQIGAKYYNAFNVKNLMLQGEYNRVRPYTYSHNSIVLNYGHTNQSMAHLWGANFSESILIARYNYKRWFGDVKLVFGKRGFDFNTDEDSFAYGGDIYTTEDDRPAEIGITVGQGNTTNIFHGEFQGGYLVNPATNLKLFAYLSFRDFNPEAETAATLNSNTVWFTLGLRTDLFNWYFDF